MQLSVLRLTILSMAVVALPNHLFAANEVTQNLQTRVLENLIDEDVLVADVVVDGETLLRVRGIQATPADERAGSIERRIVSIAEDLSIDPASGRVLPHPDYDGLLLIVFGNTRVTTLIPEDAELEQVSLDILAEASLAGIKSAIISYREARSPGVLLRAITWFAVITVVAAVLLYLLVKLFGWLHLLITRRMKARVEQLEEVSQSTIDAGQIWNWLGGLVRGLRIFALATLVLVWLETALGLFPWTRPFAQSLLQLVVDPLISMGVGLLEVLPDIAFLVILYFLVRFVLRATKVYFQRIDSGRIRLETFEQEWAMPTYRIVRMVIIAFSLVVAYPYIPGSSSDAFKGLSLLFGVVFSLGSTSFISNTIAGYSLTYRRAFRVGDMVRIGDIVGQVTDMRVMITHIRSLKNEDINLPNSIVTSSAVTNYTALQKDPGLILHTEVSIGYDTPWRQVEAMLLMAADRTTGLAKEPKPFVLQKRLSDFAVVYEVNAFCNDASRMYVFYDRLHANIQDVFNEHGVQIMSPAYEKDPDQPKVVPPDNWYPEPAIKPAD